MPRKLPEKSRTTRALSRTAKAGYCVEIVRPDGYVRIICPMEDPEEARQWIVRNSGFLEYASAVFKIRPFTEVPCRSKEVRVGKQSRATSTNSRTTARVRVRIGKS